MSGKNSQGASQLATRFATPVDSWPAYPGREPDPLSNFGLYLYLRFEDPVGNEWWPLDDESANPGRLGTRTTASRQKFRRTGR
jgi:hypothetical protein